MSDQFQDKSDKERLATLEAEVKSLKQIVADNYKKNEASHSLIYHFLERNSNRFYYFLFATISGLAGLVILIFQIFGKVIEALGRISG